MTDSTCKERLQVPVTTETEEWYASTDEENWTYATGPFPSRKAAIAHGPDPMTDEETGDLFFVGRKERFRPWVLPSWVIEEAGNQASEQCGEYADDWPPKFTTEQEDELGEKLSAVLNEWLAAHGATPECFTMELVSDHCWAERDEAKGAREG